MGAVTVAGEKYEIGTASARQVAGVAKILSNVGLSARKSLDNISEGDYVSVIAALFGAVTEDELVELGALCIGADKEFVEQNFDLLWVSEALAILMEETDLAGVVRNFTRIASRFQG